jgi:hypothetical protein
MQVPFRTSAESLNSRNPVFDRYARVSPPLTTNDAEPQNILLDLGDSFNDFLFDTDDTRVRKALVDADHSDLCADVDDKGKFQVRIDNKMFDCEIKFTKSGRYNVTSRDLDGHFFAKSDGGRQSAMTFTQILNRNQAFRLIPKKQGVVYANGTFYLPQGFEPRPDGTISQLQDVIAVPILSVIITEKGEDLYFPKMARCGLAKCPGSANSSSPTPRSRLRIPGTQGAAPFVGAWVSWGGVSGCLSTAGF